MHLFAHFHAFDKSCAYVTWVAAAEQIKLRGWQDEKRTNSRCDFKACFNTGSKRYMFLYEANLCKKNSIHV